MRVRSAEEKDAPGIAEIHVRSWQAAYRGVLPDPLLDGLSISEREESWRALLIGGDGRRLTLVAVGHGGGLTGFCSAATPSGDDGVSETTAEIGALYVDPVCWRQGIGSAILSVALAELTAQGWHDAILWVLPENRPALAFYDRFGFVVEEEVEKREERSGRRVIRLRVPLEKADDFSASLRCRTSS